MSYDKLEALLGWKVIQFNGHPESAVLLGGKVIQFNGPPESAFMTVDLHQWTNHKEKVFSFNYI